jgi:phosphotransferase system enzyme I (PtsP)
MLELLRRLTGHARPAGVPLSLCGEMAGNPVDAMALLAIGFRSLSMAAPSIGPVRQMIRSIDLSLLTPYVMDVMSRGGAGMRAKLAAFARDHGVMIG